MANENNLTSISQAGSIVEIADFWDMHDAVDYDDQTHKDVIIPYSKQKPQNSKPL